MFGRLAAAPHLAHGRALVGRQCVYLALAWPLPVLPCPARTRPPPAAAGHRAGSRTVVDGRGKARSQRRRGLRPPDWPLQLRQALDPAEPFDRELGQVERGDPGHRTHPVRGKRDCRSAGGPARPTSARVRLRGGEGGAKAHSQSASGSWRPTARSTGSGRGRGGGGTAASASFRRKRPAEADGSLSGQPTSPRRQRRRATHRAAHPPPWRAPRCRLCLGRRGACLDQVPPVEAPVHRGRTW